MKKLFTFLMAAMLFTTAFAAEVVYTLDTSDAEKTQGSSNSYAGNCDVTVDDITWNVNGNSQQHPWRLGGKSITNVDRTVFTKTATSQALSKVTLELGGATNITINSIKLIASTNADFSNGTTLDASGTAGNTTYEFEPAGGFASGSYFKFVFNVTVSENTNRFVQFKKVEFYADGGATTVSTPKFSVAAGTYHSAQTVAINCSTSGASIYYTLDGTTPSASSNVYTAPLNITTSTTVKAIAGKGEMQSEVATAAYVIESSTSVANIAAYQNVADDTYVQFANPVNVLANNGKSLYVKDETGYALIYGDLGKTYKNGDVVPAGFTGLKITYNGQPELSCYPTDGFQAAAGNTPIDPETITTTQVSSALFGHYVLIKGAKIAYNSKTITDAAGVAQVRTGMGGYGSSTDSTKVYDVVAIIGTTKDGDNFIPVVLPVKLTEQGGGEPVDGLSIAEYQKVADNTVVTFKNPAIVLAVSGQRMFVKDDTGYMLVYGSTGKTYAQGNVIPAGFGGKKTTYDGEPELMKDFTGFKDATSSVLVQAETLTGEDMMGHANFGHFVVAKNVTIVSTDAQSGTLTLENGESVKYYNNMGANLPTDLTKKYDVYGIIGSYGKTNTIYQLLTTKITEAGGGDVSVPEVANLQALYGLNKGTNAKITSDMVAVYQNGYYLYVKNGNDFGLIYGYLSNKFENGDVMKNVIASWTEYNGAKQLTAVDSTVVATGKVAAVAPTEIALEEVGTDMVHNYLVIKDATLTATETANTYMLADETMDNVKLFNKWPSSVQVPEDLTKTYDVECFVTLYNGEIELYPVAIKGEAAVPGDVNNDGTVDISDVNIIINIILGSDEATKYDGRADVNKDGTVDISDVNLIINMILGN